MPSIRPFTLAAALALMTVLAHGATLRAEDAPKIDVTKSAAIQRYQLKGLTLTQLQTVERKPEKAYKTVYETLLTRKGLDRKYREEAAAALAQIEGTDSAVAILEGIGLVPAEDKGTSRELVGLLMAQKPEALSKQKEKLEQLAEDGKTPTLKQAAYAALATADGKPDAVWTLAEGKSDLPALLSSIALIADGKVRESFYGKVQPLLGQAPDTEQRTAAIDAAGSIPGHDAEIFKSLAAIIGGEKGAERDAAIRSLGRIPPDRYPKDQVQPLADKVLELIKQMPAEERSGDAGVSAVQLGNELASALPGVAGNSLRKQLRAAAVQVVAIRTFREQMLYDTRWFAVQAGKPVKVVLENDDFMPHNIVIVSPGSLEKVGTAAGTMTPPADEQEKAFIPELPEVLQSSHLAQGDEKVSLSFNAPQKPGEYPFVCTFPGHWVRMYGVMVVVPDLDAFDRNPKPPLDPLTRKPLVSKKNDPLGVGPPPTDHQH